MVEGGLVLDDDGRKLYALDSIIHGDRFQVGYSNPARPGLQGVGCQQRNPSKLWLYGYDFASGVII